MQLVLATSNVHKVREMRAMLKPIAGLDILSLLDFPSYQSPEETGTTFEENATLKAVLAAKLLNKWVIADDSGLVVPALQGAPGVFSARYAGKDASDIDNRRKLLREMGHLSEMDRGAYYECYLALASPKGLKKCVKGRSEGTIVTEEKGSRGFGYDPIFKKHEYGKTFGELTEEIKNRISHRRKALDKLLPVLESLIENLSK